MRTAISIFSMYAAVAVDLYAKTLQGYEEAPMADLAFSWIFGIAIFCCVWQDINEIRKHNH